MNYTADGSAKAPPADLWHNPSYVSLVIAQLISIMGAYVTYVALPWFVLTTTGSPGKMVTVLLAETLPLAIFGIPLGAVVDRLNLKRLMVFLDVARGFLILAIPVLDLLGVLEFWHILAVCALSGLPFTPYVSSRMAIVPALIGEDEQDLTRANTALQFAMQMDAIIGPATAGVLIGVIGNVNVIFLNAATFFVSALLVAFGVTYRYVPRRREEGAQWIGDLRSGLGFVWAHRLIRMVVILGLFVMLSFSMLWDGVHLAQRVMMLFHAG
ncbi:MAG: MFS transporter, partial [Chloroflexi bacterium]|nr:MFS transporter [Chloroflexota bacterium]